MRKPDPLSDKSHLVGSDAEGEDGFSANLRDVDLRKARNTHLVAAALLAAVVVFVFWALQDYGPESAIRKFHMGVMHRSRSEVQAVTEQEVSSQGVQLLVQRVMEANVAGATYYVARMDRRPGDVRAAVVYTYPNGYKAPMVWVVEKQGAAWKVDANRTLTIFRDAMGF